MRNAPFWTLHPAGCDDVLISGLRILNDLNVANSDGIDPDHSTNVRIIGCHVTCADDCICLKSSSGNMEYGPLKNVIISGCTLTSTSAALKIGTEGAGDFENVVVDNCIISDSNRGISIQIRDGGNVRNVSFSNIIIETRRFAECWWGCAEPITISTHDRDEHTKSGHISNVRFSNITCDFRFCPLTPDNPVPVPVHLSVILGCPEAWPAPLPSWAHRTCHSSPLPAFFPSVPIFLFPYYLFLKNVPPVRKQAKIRLNEIKHPYMNTRVFSSLICYLNYPMTLSITFRAMVMSMNAMAPYLVKCSSAPSMERPLFLLQ